MADLDFDFSSSRVVQSLLTPVRTALRMPSSTLIASSPTSDFLQVLSTGNEQPEDFGKRSLMPLAPPSLRNMPSVGSLASVNSTASSVNSASSARTKSSSSYWRVPDASQFLTSVAVQNSLCAVGSGSHKENLFIYELVAGQYITHHQTVSLPEIYSLDWVPTTNKIGSRGNVLVSGHSGGYVHMTLLPDTNGKDKAAAILKRYNHARHLPKDQTAAFTSARVRHVNVVGNNWACCPESSIASLCAEHLFLWDPTRSDVPVVNHRIRNALCFDLCDSCDGVLAVGAKRGISIRDIRVRGGGSGLSPPEGNNEPVTQVRWSPHDEYRVAAVHGGSTVKVWDIRASKPLASYKGHTDSVRGVEWSPDVESEVMTASLDGTVRIWDIRYPEQAPQEQASEASPNRNSAYGMYRKRQQFDEELDNLALELLEKRPHVDQTRQFNAMAVAGPNAVVSVDSTGYLGYHHLRGAVKDDYDDYDELNDMLSFSPSSSARTSRSDLHSDSHSEVDFLAPL